MYRAAAVTLLLVVASSATAQVIYQPVQYQYTNGMTYYYGGNSPAMFRHIEQVKCRDGYPSDLTGHHYTSLYHTLRQTTEPCYVFTDCFRGNAAVYGYTAVDACNEAMSNVPLYYTKRDLLNAAVPADDGLGLVVPAMGAPGGAMKMMGGSMGATTQPSEPKPRAIIIIPKGALKRPADQDDLKKVVASAR